MDNKKTSKNNHNYNKIKEKYNNILKEKQQSIYIEFLDGDVITFSNKKIFYGYERKSWMNRIRGCPMIVENFDRIIDDEISVNDIKKKFALRGGKILGN